jgi:PEP-CTERM motif-containing protein
MSASGRAVVRGMIAAIAATWLGGGTARAAQLPFTGSIAVTIASFGIGVPGQGVADVAASGTHLTGLAIGAGAFQASGLTVSITTPAAAPVRGIQITAQNGAGSFARPGGGAMPLLGTARACLFGACPNAIANLLVPLSVVGAGGTVTAQGPVNVTVVGAPWTTGTAVVGSATAMGFARGPAQSSSTAQASGEIQLVTPIRILTDLPGDAAELSAFGVLTLHFVPEPTTVALVGGGLLATALAGRRKRRA